MTSYLQLLQNYIYSSHQQIEHTYWQIMIKQCMFYWTYWSEYVIIWTHDIINDTIVSSYLPILIPIVVVISFGNIWHIGKNLIYLLLKVVIACTIMIVCIKFNYLKNFIIN
jgi:hypothetical protein